MTKAVNTAQHNTAVGTSGETTTARAVKGRHSYSLQVLPSSAAACVHLSFTNSGELIPASASSTPPSAAAAARVVLTVDEWQRIAAVATTTWEVTDGDVVSLEQAAPVEGVHVWAPLWRLWLRLSASAA
jgi:hypothetical protein